MKKIKTTLSILIAAFTFSANAGSVISTNPTADLGFKIIPSQTAPENMNPIVIQKDGFNPKGPNAINGTNVTYEAEITVKKTTDTISVSQFQEFGMEVKSFEASAPFGKLNINNQVGAKLVVFEVVGDKSSAVSNTVITILGHKADFIFTNKLGSIFNNTQLNNIGGFSLSKKTSADIIKSRMPSTLKITNIAVNPISDSITIEKNGTLKSFSN